MAPVSSPTGVQAGAHRIGAAPGPAQGLRVAQALGFHGVEWNQMLTARKRPGAFFPLQFKPAGPGSPGLPKQATPVCAAPLQGPPSTLPSLLSGGQLV